MRAGGLTRAGARLGLAAAAFCAAASPSFAQGAAPAAVVGWAELEARDVPAAYAHAAAAVPRLLMKELAFATGRLPGEAEAAAMDRGPEGPGLEGLRSALAAARRAADLVAISVDDPARRSAELATAMAGVRKAEAALTAALASSPPASGGPEAREAGRATDGAPEPAPTAAGRPIVALTPWSGHARGELLPPTSDPADGCSRNKLDILVHGRVRYASGYLAFELSVYLAATGETVWTGAEYAFPDDLSAAVAAFVRPVATALMGRPYARISLAAFPADAAIRIDGEPLAGSSFLAFEPGAIDLSAVARGYRDAVLAIAVTPGEDRAVELRLEPVPAPAVLLDSEPAGATVRLDGIAAGTTPLELPGAAFSRVARLELPGYEPLQLVVPPLAEDIPAAVLAPAPGALGEADGFSGRFDAAKDRFYRSLGWFVLSLPASVLSYGSFTEYRSALAALAASGSPDPTLAETLNTRYYTVQAVFWASAAASVGLGVNAALSLIRYIDAAR